MQEFRGVLVVLPDLLERQMPCRGDRASIVPSIPLRQSRVVAFPILSITRKEVKEITGGFPDVCGSLFNRKGEVTEFFDDFSGHSVSFWCVARWANIRTTEQKFRGIFHFEFADFQSLSRDMIVIRVSRCDQRVST